MKEEPPSMESILEMEKDISDIRSLDLEDYNLINGGMATAADFDRLRDKYKDRPDLVNVVNSYDPELPLYKERVGRVRQMIEATKAGNIETVREVLEWKRSIFGKKE